MPQRLQQFEQLMKTQAEQFPSNHLLVPMGMDFAYGKQFEFSRKKIMIKITMGFIFD